MAYYGSIEITDADNWSKTFALDKTRVMVGSAPFNDLVLSEERGGGVYPAHLQLFYSPADPCRLRVVNLVNQVLVVQSETNELVSPILPNASGYLESGDSVNIGSFRLKISMQEQSGDVRVARSDHLSMRLELPELVLRPDATLMGRLLVSNCGDQPHCQFIIDLEGLPPECYRIDPAPLLYPGGEEYLKISFTHRRIQPVAGKCNFIIRATAPTSYPTEVLFIDGSLDVLPYYGYDLDVDDGLREDIPDISLEPALGVPSPLQEQTGIPHSTVSKPQAIEQTPQYADQSSYVTPVPELILPAKESEEYEPIIVEPPSDAREAVSDPGYIQQEAVTDQDANIVPPEFVPQAPVAAGAMEEPSPIPAHETEPESEMVSEDQAQPEETEEDWWSDTPIPAAKAASVDPVARLGPTKRHALRPGQNVPVLKAESIEEIESQDQLHDSRTEDVAVEETE